MRMTVEPVKPQEIAQAKRDVFPPFVLQAFNQLIAEKFTNRRATVKQNEVIDRIILLADSPDVTRTSIFDKGWLNVEEVYRDAGWKVEYDKPGYNEDYSAFFVFKQP